MEICTTTKGETMQVFRCQHYRWETLRHGTDDGGEWSPAVEQRVDQLFGFRRLRSTPTLRAPRQIVSNRSPIELIQADFSRETTKFTSLK